MQDIHTRDTFKAGERHTGPNSKRQHQLHVRAVWRVKQLGIA